MCGSDDHNTTVPSNLCKTFQNLCFSYLGKGLGTSLQIFDILKEWLKKISVMVITNWKCFTCYLLGYGNFEVLWRKFHKREQNVNYKNVSSKGFYDLCDANSLKWERYIQKLSQVKYFIKIFYQAKFCLHNYSS